MKRRTFLLGGVTATLGGSALLGSGAFSETDSQRVVKIEVEDDENAYLRLVYDSHHVDCDETVVLVALTNHLKETLTDVDVSYSSTNDDVTISGLSVPESLAVGETGLVTVDVDCTPGDAGGGPTEPSEEGGGESDETSSEGASDDPGEGSIGTSSETTVMFDVVVRSDDLDLTAQDREVQITCHCPNPPSGEEEGEGGTDEDGTDEDGTDDGEGDETEEGAIEDGNGGEYDETGESGTENEDGETGEEDENNDE